MNMVWHLLWKDIRRFKWWLVAWFGLIGVIWGLNTTAGTSIYARFLFTAIPSALFSIFGYIFIIRVVQEDPLTGRTAFWLTKPIQSWTLLLAKACFIFLLLGLPSAFESVIVTPIRLSAFWDAYSCVYAIMFVFFIWIAALCASRLVTALLLSCARAGCRRRISNQFRNKMIDKKVMRIFLQKCGLILMAMGAISLAGCATQAVEKQRELYRQKIEKEISEEQYAAKLNEIGREQPWGGNGKANPKSPMFYIWGEPWRESQMLYPVLGY